MLYSPEIECISFSTTSDKTSGFTVKINYINGNFYGKIKSTILSRALFKSFLLSKAKGYYSLNLK